MNALVLIYGSGTAYSNTLREGSEGELTREVAEHVYDLAAIARRKYIWVDRAVWLTIPGAVLAGVLLIVRC